MKTPNEMAKKNCIVRHLAGSHAYGMNTPSSDVDYRGIFVGDPEVILTPFRKVETVEIQGEEDTVYHEVSKFLQLLLSQNPNIIESLWVDHSVIELQEQEYSHIRNHRQELLTTQCMATYCGYAESQLKRLRGHHKWLQIMEDGKKQINTLYKNNVLDPLELRTYFEDEILDSLQVPYVKGILTYKNWPVVVNKILALGFHEARMMCKIPYMECEYMKSTDGLRAMSHGPRNWLAIKAPAMPNLYKVYNVRGFDLYSIEGAVIDNYQVQASEYNNLTPVHYVVDTGVLKAQQTKWEQYHTWRKNRNIDRAALEANYGYDCYSSDTEFLTENGWKLYDDITEDELLATFNPDTHRVEYQPALERFDSKYNGNMFSLKGYHVDTLTTANHKMYVRPFSRTTRTLGDWGFVDAARYPETFDTLNVIQPKINRQKLPEGIDPRIFEYCELLTYMKLVGWYVSDGTCNYYENGEVKHIMISQSKPQSTLTKSLQRFTNNGKIDCKHYLMPVNENMMNKYPEHRWILPRSISTIIENDCGHLSKNKRLPKWCFQLTKREMTSLLVALLQGDGSKKNHQTHTYVYYTINSLLADDVQRLAFLCGYETSKYGPYYIKTTDDSVVQNTNGSSMYHVHIHMRPVKTRRHTRSCSVESIPVTDHRIVCFMTKNHTLVTRRNGQIGLHGNCKHASHLIRLLKTGYEILTDEQVYVKRPDAKELLDIRNGSLTLDELLKYSDSLHEKIRKAAETSKLPKEPNIDLAKKLLIHTYQAYWDRKNLL